MADTNPFKDPRVNSSGYKKKFEVIWERYNKKKKSVKPKYEVEKLPLINDEGKICIRFRKKYMNGYRSEKIYIDPEMYRLLRELCGNPTKDKNFYVFNFKFNQFTVKVDNLDFDDDEQEEVIVVQKEKVHVKDMDVIQTTDIEDFYTPNEDDDLPF